MTALTLTFRVSLTFMSLILTVTDRTDCVPRSVHVDVIRGRSLLPIDAARKINVRRAAPENIIKLINVAN